jgi:hypothetical protein
LASFTASAEKPAASNRRVVFAVGMLAIAAAFLLARTDFAALAKTPGEESEHHYEDHD